MNFILVLLYWWSVRFAIWTAVFIGFKDLIADIGRPPCRIETTRFLFTFWQPSNSSHCSRSGNLAFSLFTSTIRSFAISPLIPVKSESGQKSEQPSDNRRDCQVPWAQAFLIECRVYFHMSNQTHDAYIDTPRPLGSYVSLPRLRIYLDFLVDTDSMICYWLLVRFIC